MSVFVASPLPAHAALSMSPLLASPLGEPSSFVFADAAQSGRLVFELAEQSAAAREIAALAAEVARIAP